MSILKKLLNKSLYQTGGVKFVKTVTPKPKQTSSYTPSNTTVKVIDPKTGRPLYYDPTYDALFDPTTGNQLDSDDHRDIREVGKGGNRVKQAALIQNKRNELQTKGITSEYASRYRPGESEKIALLLNSRFGDTEKKGIILGTPYQETKNHGDYATSVDGSDIVSKADYIVKGDYLKDDISDVESALKMQFGLPQSNKDKATNSFTEHFKLGPYSKVLRNTPVNLDVEGAGKITILPQNANGSYTVTGNYQTYEKDINGKPQLVSKPLPFTSFNNDPSGDKVVSSSRQILEDLAKANAIYAKNNTGPLIYDVQEALKQTIETDGQPSVMDYFRQQLNGQ